MWKHGDGWGLYSGTALDGCANGDGNTNYDSPQELLTWVDATNGVFDGLALLRLPGVNSQTDGLLFTVADDENNSERGPSANNAALQDGSGWYVAVRDIQTSAGNPTVYATDGNSDAGSSFSFIYIPWNADNLIAGHIRGTNGATIKGAGNFTVTRLSTGHYSLSIPGKSDSDGVLMLLNSGYLANQPTGMSNVVDNSFLSYEYGGTNVPNNVFMIDAVTISDSDAVVFADADFNFVWVDYANPLAPPGTVPAGLEHRAQWRQRGHFVEQRAWVHVARNWLAGRQAGLEQLGDAESSDGGHQRAGPVLPSGAVNGWDGSNTEHSSVSGIFGPLGGKELPTGRGGGADLPGNQAVWRGGTVVAEKGLW